MESIYTADENRYAGMTYRRCGRSGILLPAISLGLWHNFGSVDVFNNFIKIAYTAFDNGITHFDLANNYGLVYGSAEENFGRILKKGLGAYRDELLISTKAGYDMELTRQVAEAVSVPVIASGGAGKPEHFYDVLTAGKAEAALAASLFHYKELEIRQVKEYLAGRDVAVRL